MRSYRKNVLQQKNTESDGSGMFVKVSMDGAPYLRKIDLKFYRTYFDLLKALENMFKCTIGNFLQFFLFCFRFKVKIRRVGLVSQLTL